MLEKEKSETFWKMILLIEICQKLFAEQLFLEQS